METRCKKCGLIMKYPNATSDSEQEVCNYCTDFSPKVFLGEDALVNILGNEGKIGVCVSGGKDSLFLWQWAVLKLGKDRVVAFNHHKTGMVHPIALENIKRAQEILGSELVIINDDEFYPRFVNNIQAYLRNPEPAIARAVLCAGCRFGISYRIFEECRKHNISTVLNGASYLEIAPFKEYQMREYGEGNEVRGLLRGLADNPAYQEKDNLLTIIRDHFVCHVKDLSNRPNEYGIRYIDFYDYIENKPQHVKEVVVRDLDWRQPEGQSSWHFDCAVEDFKQLFYYLSYGYSELDYKSSAMVRYGLMSREESIRDVTHKHEKLLAEQATLRDKLLNLGCEASVTELFDNVCQAKQ